jgi:hypothetical protein
MEKVNVQVAGLTKDHTDYSTSLKKNKAQIEESKKAMQAN